MTDSSKFKNISVAPDKDLNCITSSEKIVVILDKDSYLKLVETLLTDSSKFRNISVAPEKDLNCIISSEKVVTDLLEKLKNKNAISEETYNKLRPVGSKPGTLYGSAKVHKALKMDYHHSDPFFQRLAPLHTN